MEFVILRKTNDTKRNETCWENVIAAAIDVEEHRKTSLHGVQMDTVLKLGHCNLCLINSFVNYSIICEYVERTHRRNEKSLRN